MFTVLFTIAKTRKQPKCPSMDKSIKCDMYTDTDTHTHNYSAIKKEILPSATTWRDLESIMLSKSDREIHIPYDLTYM